MGIPSPSNMTLGDLLHVLVGSIPESKNIDDLPQCHDTEIEDLKLQYNRVEKIFTHYIMSAPAPVPISHLHLSESDVCHKVFTLLFALFPYCQKNSVFGLSQASWAILLSPTFLSKLLVNKSML